MTIDTGILNCAGSVFVRNTEGSADSKVVEDPKGSLSQKVFDLSHARFLLRRARPGIEADQARFPTWNRRSRIACRERETISSYMEYLHTALCLLNQG
jgi:hypothetical protein